MSAPMTQGQRLSADAAAAADVRSYQTDPDVVALRVERVRSQVERLMWTGMVLGLSFTMVNVQQFATDGAVVGSLAWCAAWLLDPMVSLVLLGVLRAEQITARWQVPMGPWPRVAKWALLSATYAMNTWASWAAGSPSGIVLHSVPVLTVFVAAEAVTDCQDKLTECVHRAHAWARARARWRVQAEQDTSAADTAPAPEAGQPAPPVPVEGTAGQTLAPIPPVTGHAEIGRTPGEQTAPHPQTANLTPTRAAVSASSAAARPPRPVAARRVGRPAARRTSAGTRGGGRVLFADYLASAQAALTPEVEITPAWVRHVTGCSRGLSSRLAAQLRAEHRPVPAAPAVNGTDESDIDLPVNTTDRTHQPEGKAA